MSGLVRQFEARHRKSSAGFVGLAVFLAISAVGGLVVLFVKPVDRSAQADTETQDQPQSRPLPIVTMRMYDRLVVGQTYDQCRRELPFDGTLLSSSEAAIGDMKIATSIYRWGNPGGSNCVLIFQNGVLLSKAQAELK